MNWKERYATEKDAGKIRKKMMEIGLRAVPGIGKGTGKALAEGAETLLSGGTVGEAGTAAIEEFGPIGKGVARAIQDPKVQKTVSEGIGKVVKKLKGNPAPESAPIDYMAGAGYTPSTLPPYNTGKSPDDIGI